MPAAVLVMNPRDIVGQNHPTVSRDPTTNRILTETVSTPFFLYTVTFTRNADALQTIARVDITVVDAP